MITQLDFSILYAIQNIRNDLFDWFFPFITKLGNSGIFWILLGICLICFKKTRTCGICVLACLAIGALIGEVFIKNVICRQRPCIQQPIENMLVAIPTSFSFPSGHSASSFTAATAIFLNHRKAGIAAYILAALIAFSRLYCYVHFPTDVLCGAILGIIVACLVTHKIKKYISSKQTNQNL